MKTTNTADQVWVRRRNRAIILETLRTSQTLSRAGLAAATRLNPSTVSSIISELIKERPQVALVDVNLQLGSGLDIVRAIRLKPEIKNTRILMYSGLYLKDECLKAGADGFIQKPFMPDELLELIHTNSHQM